MDSFQNVFVMKEKKIKKEGSDRFKRT